MYVLLFFTHIGCLSITSVQMVSSNSICQNKNNSIMSVNPSLADFKINRARMEGTLAWDSTTPS